MFEDIGFDGDLNVTLFYTPEHMSDMFGDIVDRSICWDIGLDVAYGDMFEEYERNMF